MLVEQTRHRKQTGSGEIDELSVSIEEHLARVRAAFLPEKQPFDIERVLRVSERLLQQELDETPASRDSCGERQADHALQHVLVVLD